MNSIDIGKNENKNFKEYFKTTNIVENDNIFINMYFDISEFLSDNLQDKIDNLINKFLYENIESTIYSYHNNFLFIGIRKKKYEKEDNSINKIKNTIYLNNIKIDKTYDAISLFTIIYNYYKEKKELTIKIVSNDVDKYNIKNCDYFEIYYKYSLNKNIEGLFIS